MKNYVQITQSITKYVRTMASGVVYKLTWALNQDRGLIPYIHQPVPLEEVTEK